MFLGVKLVLWCVKWCAWSIGILSAHEATLGVMLAAMLAVETFVVVL